MTLRLGEYMLQYVTFLNDFTSDIIRLEVGGGASPRDREVGFELDVLTHVIHYHMTV